jgi:hypothetical protein
VTTTTTDVTSSSTIDTTTNSSVAVPASQTTDPDDNVALIGGIVGGVVALILIVGLISFLVMRCKRSAGSAQPANQDDVVMAPAPAPSSNYGRINSSLFSDESASATNYDNPSVLMSNSNYDDPSVLS